jgi:light-regulated signal transduction histidine kinase (bacteriophytochrome)
MKIESKKRRQLRSTCRTQLEDPEQGTKTRVLLAEDDDEMRDIVSRAFEVMGFEVIEATDGSEMRGTGLGLSIVHSIVREHGGFIEVTSQLHSRTTFRVWLPEGDDKLQAAAV